MGLDMYLHKKTYVKQWDHIPEDKQFEVKVTRGSVGYDAIKPERVAYVIEEIAYWRKANAIHKWFVDKVQNGKDDCGEYYVEKGRLRELLDDVNKVLDAPASARNVLPTTRGFFFGSTDYDHWYFEDMRYTKKILEETLNNEDNGDYGDRGTYYYRSSW